MPSCTTASTTWCRRPTAPSVVMVSPTLLMLAIQVIQQIQKDARMREAADLIRAEVGHLMDDVGRLATACASCRQHFGQANEDVRQVLISAEKIEKRGDRIGSVEFGGRVAGRRRHRADAPAAECCTSFTAGRA